MEEKNTQEAKNSADELLQEINREFAQAAARHGHLAQQIRNAETFVKRAQSELTSMLNLMDRLGTKADRARKKAGLAPVTTTEAEVLDTSALHAAADAADALDSAEGANA